MESILLSMVSQLICLLENDMQYIFTIYLYYFMCMFMHGLLVKLTSQTFVWPHINIVLISSFKCFKCILINKYLNLKYLNIKSLSFIEKPLHFNNNKK